MRYRPVVGCIIFVEVRIVYEKSDLSGLNRVKEMAKLASLAIISEKTA